jgi:hypothetical protein
MEAARKFGIRLVPITDVLNREGLLVGAGDGPIELAGAEFIQFLESLLSVL